LSKLNSDPFNFTLLLTSLTNKLGRFLDILRRWYGWLFPLRPFCGSHDISLYEKEQVSLEFF